MGGGGSMEIKKGEPYFGGGAGAIPQDALAGLGAGGHYNPGTNPYPNAGSPGTPGTGMQSPGGALAQLFASTSINPIPRVQLPQITRPTSTPMPSPSGLPQQQAPASGPMPSMPQGWSQYKSPMDYALDRDPAKNMYQAPDGNVVDISTGRWSFPNHRAGDGANPLPSYAVPLGLYQMAGGAAGGAGGYPQAGQGAPLSNAAQLARQMNAAAAAKGR